MTNNRSSSPSLDPLNQYTDRLAARRAALAEVQQRSRKIWILRRIVFGAIFVALVLAFEGTLSPWWIALPVAVFIALMAIHQRIHQTRDRLEGSVKFYERGIARLEDRWA